MSGFRKLEGARVSFFAFQDIITSVTGILILVTLLLGMQITPNQSQEAAENLQRLQEMQSRYDDLNRRQITANEAQLEMSETLGEAAGIPDVETLRQQISESRRETSAVRERLRQIASKEVDAKRLADQRKEIAGITEAPALIKAAEAAAPEIETALKREKEETARRRAQLETARDDLRKLTADSKCVRLAVNPAEAMKPIIVDVSASQAVIFTLDKSNQTVTMPADQLDGFNAALSKWDSAKNYVLFYVRPPGIKNFRALKTTATDAHFTVGYDALEEDQKITLAGSTRETDEPPEEKTRVPVIAAAGTGQGGPASSSQGASAPPIGAGSSLPASGAVGTKNADKDQAGGAENSVESPVGGNGNAQPSKSNANSASTSSETGAGGRQGASAAATPAAAADTPTPTRPDYLRFLILACLIAAAVLVLAATRKSRRP